ncbi:hypothetical protein ASPCADRAFT_179858 [Aspergillus carbonarius ITEM 5010]|uniref:Uncharacterized protein n=1 Tax=Aspergillus carbonarius (strain ITEM 5010) TaxID=602072 RepID=A0A1R3R6C2_ASPC5|nr:hypothetical protein ASPCADRAFT_179858 [Aspergillus carbonarius ITEM 5010]
MSTTSSMEETMKDLLDRGEVKPSWRDKQFVHFLDLKEAYGREFLARVKEHAESTGFSWADLAKFENERRTCAKMFVDNFGMAYWGTPANRQKYLQEECLDDPDTLCVYPDRRDEYVRSHLCFSAWLMVDIGLFGRLWYCWNERRRRMRG